MAELPIACSLDSADQELRIEQWRALVGSSMRGHQRTDRGVEVVFDRDVRVQLEWLIEAESRCCPFLEWDLGDQTSRLRLTVEGPELAQPIIDELFGLRS